VTADNVEYRDVTITAAQATREGPPGMITLRYTLSALPAGWAGNFHEAYNVTFVTFRPAATFKDIDQQQLVLTMREEEATAPTLATVRRNLDQAIAAANHKTQTELVDYRLGAHTREEQAERDEDRLSEIQAILDQQ